MWIKKELQLILKKIHIFILNKIDKNTSRYHATYNLQLSAPSI